MPRGKKNFTPTQDLILDVLVSRRRLGELIWPFSTELTRQLMQLEGLGWVHILSGQVEGSIRAQLSDAGVKEFIENSSYESPLMKKLQELEQDVEVLTRLLERRD
jgi:hypothetical protein